MDSLQRVRRGITATCAVATIALVMFGLAVVYGVSEEYAGGAGLEVLPLVVLVAGVVAGLATGAWPGLRPRIRWGVPLAVAVVVALGGLAAVWLGDHAREQRLLSESENFTCNGPNAEVLVDERVDATFAELPRRARIYGPIGGTPAGCTAAVDGDGETTFAAYAAAFRDLEGWRVTEDRTGRFVMERDDVEVTLTLTGSPEVLSTLQVQIVS